MNAPRTSAPLLALLILSACVPSTVSQAPSSTPAPVRSAAFYGRAPEGLAGADARKLVAMFGTPRLDIREPTVRKLQFTNGRCVLDAYLYAPARRKEPVVTHVDTRLINGNDVDPAACIQSLQAN